ncbi:MAG TPA: hypothetical protein VNJ07_02040, partial [Chitinophagales bacterium]|nr:hypothetical protein [Chitinophagales bacterium]
DDKISDQLGLSVYSRYWKNKPEFNRLINLQRVFGTIVAFPFLKRPLLFIARNNLNLLADAIFGIYFLIWLTFYFNITPRQLISYFTVWFRSAFSDDKSPSAVSIREGDGQLYPDPA